MTATPPAPQPDVELGTVLDRVYRTVHPTLTVTTDGRDYYPDVETEHIAAELGFARQPGDRRMNPYGRFAADADGAQARRTRRLQVALRVARRAGADVHDVETLRAALGVELPTGLLAEFADEIDQRNEQSRRHWIEQAQRLQAIATVHAREEGRRRGLREALNLTGDARFADLIRAAGCEPEDVAL